MYHPLTQRMQMDFTVNPIEHSQAVPLRGQTALLGQVTLLNCSDSTATLTVTIEISDDLENWRDSGATAAVITGTPRALEPTNGGAAQTVDAQHGRLRYELTAEVGTYPRALIRSGLELSRS